MAFWYKLLIMFKGEFEFNLQEALKSSRDYDALKYCDAYHTTNEPIENWLPLTPGDNQRVLTVAASGDQPLMYATAGARHVDTFDVTVNACVVMDFKTTALKRLDYSRYQNVVKALLFLNRLKPDNPITNDLYDVIANMPPRTRTLMSGLTTYRRDVFSKNRTLRLAFPAHNGQYEQMQSAVQKPFNFIWTNLISLSHYIQGEYDIINVSNIFDHYFWFMGSVDSIFYTIRDLWPYLRNGGYLVCTTTDNTCKDYLEMVPNLMPELQARISTPESTFGYHSFLPLVIQKAR